MSNTDPPDHARLRKLANKAFTARRVEALREGVQRIVDRLVDEAVAAGPAMDLIEAVASPLPMSVVCELFGIPDEDRPRVKSWFHRFGRLSEDIDKSEAAIDRYEEYLSGLIRQRRMGAGRRSDQRPGRHPEPGRPAHRLRTALHLLRPDHRRGRDHHPPHRQRHAGPPAQP